MILVVLEFFLAFFIPAFINLNACSENSIFDCSVGTSITHLQSPCRFNLSSVIFKDLKVKNCFSMPYEFWTTKVFPPWNSFKLRGIWDSSPGTDENFSLMKYDGNERGRKVELFIQRKMLTKTNFRKQGTTSAVNIKPSEGDTSSMNF